MINKALTFDDVSLTPQFSQILPSETNVSTQITPTIKLNVPIISSAMDTVTESGMAIAMAQLGGLGVIHKNLSPEKQAEEVMKVKRSGGIVQDPMTCRPHHNLYHVKELTRETGYRSFPVVDDWSYLSQNEKVLVGLLTARDIKFERNNDTMVETIMTPVESLKLAKLGDTRESMIETMYKNKVERIVIVDDPGSSTPMVKGLITLKDCQLEMKYPLATRSPDGKLCVAAAVGPLSYTNCKRVELLLKAGVDAVVVDTAHGHSKGVIEMVKFLTDFNVSIIAGNVVTTSAACDLFDAGAHCVKVGVGGGSICTTRVISGVGVPQLTAVIEVAEAIGRDGAIICDGGVRYSGDIVKALVAGANAVMVGGLLAGCDESPGTIEIYEGRAYKSYRGMGSLGAMMQNHNSSDRYGQSETTQDKLVPEGIEGRVPYTGSVEQVVNQLVGGIRSGMGYMGCETIPELWQCVECFVEVSPAGLRESHPHNVSIIREAPNYSVRL
jgi:IMP dehydrogenase